jgi:hypothetical protein
MNILTIHSIFLINGSLLLIINCNSAVTFLLKGYIFCSIFNGCTTFLHHGIFSFSYTLRLHGCASCACFPHQRGN